MLKSLIPATLVLLAASSLCLSADFPDFKSLPSRPELPDPLVMLDGTRVTTAADWNTRRKPELQALFQHYMYGYLPSKPGKWIVEEVLFTDPTFLDLSLIHI